jgi:sugar lactone lactonase YvrE
MHFARNAMKRRLVIAAALIAFACKKPVEPPPIYTADNNPQKRYKATPPNAVVTFSTGIAAPESALYDPEQDVYFISNMNGGLLDRDDNGFITRVDANSGSMTLKWIEGGKNGVTLDAPKGMAVAGNSLYVADVAAVRKFDRHTGAPQGEIALPGASCIKDVTTDGTNVYVSDTGIVGAPGTQFTPTGTDAIWEISNDQPKKIASGQDLKQPNGLAWSGGNLYVVTFGADELYELSGGVKKKTTTIPRQQLDGVVRLDDGTFFISSWYGAAIYRGKEGGTFEPILQSLQNPADIGYDTKRHRLLVPETPLNHVVGYSVR